MTKAPETQAAKRLSQGEFVALIAMLTATVAFSIDAMLPALPDIGAELSPDNVNNAQLIITSFVLGMGIGTMFTGPMSDAFGRKPVMVGGAIVYVIASAAAWAAQSLEIMLAARVVQGLGAAGPRVVAMALIRDLYAGSQMARVLSFVMMVFTVVPALAPTLGHYIILGFGWRAIFVAFMAFSAVSLLWLLIRQPETLAREDRRPLSLPAMWFAVKEMFGHRTACLSIVIQTLVFAMLFAVLSSTQQVFDITFGEAAHFHLWFGGIAIVSASASVLNALLVEKLGMRAIVKAMFSAHIAMTVLMILIWIGGPPDGVIFASYVAWMTSNFFQAGLTMGNLNALGMEEMGHIAGMAASIISAVATVGAVFLAAPVALLFDGTPLPMAIGILCFAIAARVLTGFIKRPGDA